MPTIVSPSMTRSAPMFFSAISLSAPNIDAVGTTVWTVGSDLDRRIWATLFIGASRRRAQRCHGAASRTSSPPETSGRRQQDYCPSRPSQGSQGGSPPPPWLGDRCHRQSSQCCREGSSAPQPSMPPRPSAGPDGQNRWPYGTTEQNRNPSWKTSCYSKVT